LWSQRVRFVDCGPGAPVEIDEMVAQAETGLPFNASG
jgi:hypothetical protein